MWICPKIDERLYWKDTKHRKRERSDLRDSLTVWWKTFKASDSRENCICLLSKNMNVNMKKEGGEEEEKEAAAMNVAGGCLWGTEGR